MARKKDKAKKRRVRKRKASGEVSDEFLESIGFKRKPKKKEKIIISETPQPQEEITMEKEQVIEDIFHGKLPLFLKRYYRMNRAYPIHSELIPEWQKDLKSRRALKWLNKKLEWPTHKREVINLLRTLEKYYDAEINRVNMELAWEIWELFHSEITENNTKSWAKTVARRRWEKVKKLSKDQAWAEQKAIGYIHINDFEDFDKKAAHVYSNIKREHLYPDNFYHGGYNDLKDKTHIYIALSLVGVEGYTRCVIPK